MAAGADGRTAKVLKIDECYLGAEKALAAVIQKAYVQGVSTRSVDELVKAMGMSGISKSQVSRVCAEIEEIPCEGEIFESPRIVSDTRERP
jgi:hypothetical protein